MSARTSFGTAAGALLFTASLGVLAAVPAVAGGGWSQVTMPPAGQNATSVGVSADSDSDA